MTDSADITKDKSQDQSEALLFQLTQLYESAVKEKEMTIEAQLLSAETIQQLQQAVDRFATIEEAVIVKLRKMLQATEENFTASISKLYDKALAAKKDALQSKKKRYLSNTRIFAMTMTATAIITFTATMLWVPKSPAPLTPAQEAFIASGELMAKVWPKLSKNEQRRLLEMADDIEKQN